MFKHGKTVLRSKKLDEKKVEYSPGKVHDNIVFEQGEHGSYLVYDLAEEKFLVPPRAESVWEQIETEDGQIFKPLPKLPWKPLPSSGYLEGYPPIEVLWKEIKEFLYAHIDFSEPFQYDICTAYILHTWRMENWKVTPYLFFYGPKGSGKSQALEVLSLICYRPITSPSFTSASLMRLAERYCASLFLDEAQIYSREEKAELNALLNAGYKRGQSAIRTFINKETGDEDLRFYSPFSPKCLAGTRQLLATVQDRSIVIVMSKNVRPIPLQIDELQGERLRAKLFMYRVGNLAVERGIQPIRDIPEEYLTYGRSIEILYPLIAVAPKNLKTQFFDYASFLRNERLEEDALSLESRVFSAIVAVHKKYEVLIPLNDVVDLLNLNLPEVVTNRAVGAVVSKLGFYKRMYKNRTHIIWSETVYKRLIRRYPIEEMTAPTIPKEIEWNAPEGHSEGKTKGVADTYR